MFEEAKGLLEPGEERDNPEYLRGMCNLIASCFGKEGMPTDDRSGEIEKQLIAKPKTKLKVWWGLHGFKMKNGPFSVAVVALTQKRALELLNSKMEKMTANHFKLFWSRGKNDVSKRCLAHGREGVWASPKYNSDEQRSFKEL